MERYELTDQNYGIPSIKQYYWILANVNGKTVILGAFNTEEEANRVGFEKIEGNFEVIPLSTKDTGAASRILKYRKFNQTSQLEEALKRAKHKI